MQWINRIGLGLILYLILILLLEMQEDITFETYLIFGLLGFVGATLVLMPHESKGD